MRDHEPAQVPADAQMERAMAFGYALGILNESGVHEGSEETAFQWSRGEHYAAGFIPRVRDYLRRVEQTSEAVNKIRSK